MATIATQAEATGRDCVLVTADKDCRQLITDRVSLFNLRKQSFYRAENLLEDWGIRPDQVVDFQAMVGDSSDNVPGIPLIGPKLATQLLQQYETLENILDHADEVSGQKRKENLKNGRDTAMMCRELVRLRRDVPLEIDWEAGRVQGFDSERLREMCHRFGFRSLLPKIDLLVPDFGLQASGFRLQTSGFRIKTPSRSPKPEVRSLACRSKISSLGRFGRRSSAMGSCVPGSTFAAMSRCLPIFLSRWNTRVTPRRAIRWSSKSPSIRNATPVNAA
jgi:hypothetical protein